MNRTAVTVVRIRRAGFAWALLLVLGAIALPGCATVSGGDGSFNAILKDDTGFTSGPGENVPDKYLPGGTRVRIVGTAGGGDYLRVQTVDGQIGFVPRTAITDAPDDKQPGLN